MELRTGCKPTAVGVIPEEWKVAELDTLVSVVDGDRGSEYPNGADFSANGYCLFLNAGNVTQDGFKFDECTFISEQKDALLNKGKLKRNDIVLTTRGTVGNVAYFDAAVPLKNIRINSGMVILRSTGSSLNTDYLYDFLRSRLFQTQIERLSFGSAQPQLTVKGINKLVVIVPPLEEQRIIETVLTDLEALLHALEKLIAKKRDLKEAAMQQLLTGKTRLPGFHGEWQDGTVQDVILGYFCGPSPTCEERNIADDFEWGVLKTTAVTKECGWNWRAHKVLPKIFWNTPHLEVRKDDVIVTKAGPRHRVGVAVWLDFVPPRIIVSGKMIGLRRNPAKIVPLMLASAISAPVAQMFLDQRTTGMAESQVNFENGALLETPIRFPRIEEQTAIAKVLSDMDAEITALQARRDKTRALKEGMMQELLTGRVRLV